MARPKKEVTKNKRASARLNDEDYNFLVFLGQGNISAGIERALRIVKLSAKEYKRVQKERS